VSGADVYASPALFRKLWPRLLRAAAVEAVAEHAVEAGGVATVEEVRDYFFAAAGVTGPDERVVSERVRVVKWNGGQVTLWETRDLAASASPWLHRSYVEK
jgi:hypothetical protein